ncbi:MAG: dephospho-CoA kinase [Phycisphaerales bacterium]
MSRSIDDPAANLGAGAEVRGASAATGRAARPLIGLVGGIGAGKSTVAQILRDLGCVVSDSDALAREAFDDAGVRAALRGRWGGRVFSSRGAVDRKTVATIVFGDDAERRWLESITHPWIEDRRRAMFAAAPPQAPALVIDAPLLLEAGLGPRCDAVVFVDAPREERLARVRATRGWDAGELARREAAQWPLERKRRASSIVLMNDGDRPSLADKVREALESIVRAGPSTTTRDHDP